MYVYLFHSWLFFLPNGVDLAVVPQSLVPKIAYEGLQALDSMAIYLACLNNSRLDEQLVVDEQRKPQEK